MYKVYGKNWCVYCDRAKRLLEEKKLPFEYYNIEADIDAYDYAMANSNGQKSVPIIFHEGALVGGFDNLRDHLKTL